jgi:cyclopropane fatty-acyl-phospholipid synthase-like methyltransferase
MADWYYDDLRQVGLDFEDVAAVEAYDRNQRTSAEEDLALLDRLGLNADHVVIDIGCGTGAFAIEAARRCRTVYAVDVSASMLARAPAGGQPQPQQYGIQARRVSQLCA